MPMGRRTFLGLLAAAPALAAPGRADAAQRPPMSGSGCALGTCLEMHHLEIEPRVGAVVESGRFTRLTPEYSLQWSSFEPTEGRYRFAPVDRLVAYARHAGATVQGHALLWEQGTPGWGTPDWVKARLAEAPDWGLVRRRFETVLGRYGTAIPLWTVVNEPIETSDRADGLRANAFLRAFGPGYIPAAFETAQELAPGARLMLNEYALEYENPVDRARRRAALKLVEGLKSRGLRIDAFGVQGHLELAKGKLDRRGLGGFLRDLADLGVEVHVTELDVLEHDRTLSLEARDARVADTTARFLDIVLDEPAVTSVTTWGITDRLSWLRGDFAAISQEVGAEMHHAMNRGLPFDARVAPKPMARALAGALDTRLAAL